MLVEHLTRPESHDFSTSSTKPKQIPFNWSMQGPLDPKRQSAPQDSIVVVTDVVAVVVTDVVLVELAVVVRDVVAEVVALDVKLVVTVVVCVVPVPVVVAVEVAVEVMSAHRVKPV